MRVFTDPKVGYAVGRRVLSDPVTATAYGLVAFSIGYVLANGIGGKTIPGLSHFYNKIWAVRRN